MCDKRLLDDASFRCTSDTKRGGRAMHLIILHLFRGKTAFKFPSRCDAGDIGYRTGDKVCKQLRTIN